jgi:hypothetical protein
MYESDSDSSLDESEDFWNLVLGVVQVPQKYVDMCLDKNPPRIANTSGYAWLLETLKTPGECHKQLRMSTEIFINLHDLLVSRYGLQPSMHMNTYEALAIFLFICARNESIDDRRAYPHFKNCIGALDGAHVRVALHPNEQVRYIGKSGIPT